MNNEETPLSEKHKLFIDTYFNNGMNATRAYIEAYPRASASTAVIKGSVLLRKVKNSKYYDEKSKEKQQKSNSSYDKVLNKLWEVVEQAFKGDEIFKKDGESYIKRDYRAVTAALNEINKMEGNHKETKIKLAGFLDLEHSGTVYQININKDNANQDENTRS